MSFFGKNIRKIRSLKSMSQQSFGELFDIKRATLGAYEEERSEPKIETIVKIANYFSIPIDDLLTRDLTVNEITKFKDDVLLDGDNLPKVYFTKVPCITEDLYSTYPLQLNNRRFIEQLPHLSLPIDSSSQHRGLVIKNLEMAVNEQGFYPKDIVIGEWVSPSHWENIEEGSLVIAIKQKGICFRKFFFSEGKFIFIADHKGVENKVMEKDEIQEMWLVRYVFYKRTLKNNLVEVEQKIENLEKLVQEIQINKKS